MRRTLSFLSLAIVFLTSQNDLHAQDAATPAAAIVPGSRVAIIGDSITEQKLYSKFMEAYLVACTGVPDVHVFQFGWGGEQAGGFAARMENDITVFSPTVATLCYGMNDGSYQPYNDEIGKRYEMNMRKVLEKMESLGINIASKQNFETYMIKTIITDFRSFPKEVIVDADLKQAMNVFRKSFLASQQQLDAVVQKSLVPVKHTLKITPVS